MAKQAKAAKTDDTYADAAHELGCEIKAMITRIESALPRNAGTAAREHNSRLIELLAQAQSAAQRGIPR